MKSFSKNFLAFVIRALILSLIFSPFADIAAQSATGQNTLFIFDASGSMWGKLDKSTKIQEAKETMDKLVDKIDAGANVGLIVYGHRNASDCNDIETVLPLAPLDKARFRASIKALNPKGKTPIALSIRQALELIKKTADPVTVVLISDGLETCEGNACDIIKEARSAGVKITVHVVGFGISEKDLSPLECVAQAGGGQYFPADNAEQLSAALEQTVKETPVGDAFLSVKTTLDGKLKDASVRVHRKGESKDLMSGRTYESKETNPRVMQLPAGVYEIVIMPVAIEGHPGIKLSGVEVKPADTLFKHIEFEQGVVQVLVTRNGELSDATVQVFSAGTSKVVASTRSYDRPSHNPAKLKIPPGVYDIVLSSVEISGRPVIKIMKKELGSADNMEIAHNFLSGELKIGARKGADYVDATVNIINTKTNTSVGAGRTYQSASSNPKKFILEPGSYRVELNAVKPAGLGKKSVNIEITARGTVEKTLEW